MLAELLDTTQAKAVNDDYDRRRASQRRRADACVGMIDGRPYPVENWSEGGVLLAADDRLFSMEEELEVTLKFKLSDRIMDVSSEARIVRKTRGRIGLQFQPLARDISRKFRQVVDDYVTREFVDSQVV